MKFYLLIIIGLILNLTTFAASKLKLEPLGYPMYGIGVGFFGDTRDDSEKQTLWAVYRGAEKYGLLGVDPVTGKTQWYSLKQYGIGKLQGIVSPDNKIYLLCGKNPSRFLRFDPENKKWNDLGSPNKTCSYFLSSLLTPDGKFIVGTYPNAELVWADINTKDVGSYGRIDDNERNKYVMVIKQDKSGIIYASTGLYRQRVWAYNTKTGYKKQILPKNLADKNGYIKLFLGKDGKVYGEDKINKDLFICKPESIELVKKNPGKITTNVMVGGLRVEKLHQNGNLILRNPIDKTYTFIKTNFQPDTAEIYSICGGINGKIWLGGISPACITLMESIKQSFIDLGRKTLGRIQVYCMLETQQGLFVSSYKSGAIDLINLKNRKYKSRLVVSLSKNHQQERITRLVQGKNEIIYGSSIPEKGILGGGILCIDPNTLKWNFCRNVIFEQSIFDIAVTSDGLLLGASSIEGGTSAIPSQKEAFIFLWDPASNKVVWQLSPIAGETKYSRICPINNEIFCVLASEKSKCVFVNAKTKKIINIINIPDAKNPLRLAGSASSILGEKAYLINGDQLLELDYKNSKIKTLGYNKTISRSKHINHWVSPHGVLYLGAGSQLWKINLSKITE